MMKRLMSQQQPRIGINQASEQYRRPVPMLEDLSDSSDDQKRADIIFSQDSADEDDDFFHLKRKIEQ